MGPQCINAKSAMNTYVKILNLRKINQLSSNHTKGSLRQRRTVEPDLNRKFQTLKFFP